MAYKQLQIGTVEFMDDEIPIGRWRRSGGTIKDIQNTQSGGTPIVHVQGPQAETVDIAGICELTGKPSQAILNKFKLLYGYEGTQQSVIFEQGIIPSTAREYEVDYVNFTYITQHRGRPDIIDWEIRLIRGRVV